MALTNRIPEWTALVEDEALGPGDGDAIEMSVALPCLNESASVGYCVRQALAALRSQRISAEVIVCDNGSQDDSAEVARRAGAKVVYEPRRGYGSALLRAFDSARGRYIPMADADGTYDFHLIPRFVEALRQGNDLVMGSRFNGRMTRDAMPLLHRYLGVPTLTRLLNWTAGGRVSDAHCGMRAFSREALQRMKLQATGMELASEMIVKAMRANMRIAEIPIPYYTRVGESKLRTFRDGWRHLRFLLLESPTLLYVIPGLSMMVTGLVALGALMPGRLRIEGLSFDFHYMIVGALLTILGWQVLSLGLFAKIFAAVEGLSPPDRAIRKFMQTFHLEKALAASSAVVLIGLGLLLWVLASWIQQGFGFLDGEIMLRQALMGMTLLVLGVESSFSSFFVSALMADDGAPGR